jgi:hypothetical protein
MSQLFFLPFSLAPSETEKSKMEKQPTIEYRAVDSLIPYANNSRKHSPEQIDQIAASIREFGFLSPCVVAADGTIIAGHGRVMAAMKCGVKSVPCVVADHLSEGQRRAYVILDNRLTDLGDWDKELLQLELADIVVEFPDIDIAEMGFSPEELEELDLSPIGEEEGGTEGLTNDEVPDAPATPTTKTGDIWILGNHRVMCGDSTNKKVIDRLIVGQNIDACITDPPYGISYSPGAGGRGAFGKPCHKKFTGKNIVRGDENPFDPSPFLNYPIVILWGANNFASRLFDSSCWFVWDKREAESTLSFADCEMAWTNLPGTARMFRHMWNGVAKASENGLSRLHPTQKPIALMEWCIEKANNPKNILEPFCGSGSTLIACEKTSRFCFGMEIDPHYCDVIVKRWQDFTGRLATLEGDGRTFEEIQRERVG